MVEAVEVNLAIRYQYQVDKVTHQKGDWAEKPLYNEVMLTTKFIM